MSALKPTGVRAWAGPKTVTVELPSGNVAELRPKFPVYLLLRSGVFTPELFAAFQDWQVGQLDDPSLAADLVDLILEAMFVNPKVSKAGTAGTVAIEKLDDADIDFVLEGATGGVPDPAFPDGGRGADGSPDSENMGTGALEAPGTGDGEPSGADSGHEVGRKAGRSRAASKSSKEA